MLMKSTGVGGFVSPQNGNPTTLENVESLSSCYILLC